MALARVDNILSAAHTQRTPRLLLAACLAGFLAGITQAGPPAIRAAGPPGVHHRPPAYTHHAARHVCTTRHTCTKGKGKPLTAGTGKAKPPIAGKTGPPTAGLSGPPVSPLPPPIGAGVRG